jgi:hypothetical protein
MQGGLTSLTARHRLNHQPRETGAFSCLPVAMPSRMRYTVITAGETWRNPSEP